MNWSRFRKKPSDKDWHLYHVPANDMAQQYGNRTAEKPEDVSAKPEKNRALRPIQRITLYGFIACMVISGGLLAAYGLQALRAQQTSDSLRALYNRDGSTQPASTQPSESPAAATVSPQSQTLVSWFVTEPPAEGSSTARSNLEAYPTNAQDAVDTRLSTLRQQNADIIGWLNIPNLLDEPVVQRDNTYYLTHDALRNESVSGALFLDERCALATVPENLLIHGHNMKTGTMFGCLKKYELQGESFVKNHGLISLNTLYEQATYAVIAVMVIDTTPNSPLYFDFMEKTTFSSDAVFHAYIEAARQLSLYNIPLDVQASDRLLTLSTCEGTDNTQRLLILARKVRPNETKTQLLYVLSQAAGNPTRLQ